MKNVLLKGVVGSTAYGLATKNSDQDHLGIFLAPLDSVLGLDGPQAVQESIVGFEPDSTLHEVGKYLSLALKCNPTVLELLWLPRYGVETEAGTAIIAQRQYLLSEPYVRNAYGGYAKQQADRLLGRHKEGKEGFSSDVKKRTEKHGRHCMRLLMQGGELLETGEVVIDVSQYRDFLFGMGKIAAKDPEEFYHLFEVAMDEFNNVEAILPERPDREKINDLLVKIRRQEL